MSWLGVVFGVLAIVVAPAFAEPPVRATVEPKPPEILELVLVEEGKATPGRIVVEALLLPEVDGEVEVELVDPAARFVSRAGRKARYQLRRGGRVHRERVEVDVTGARQRVRIRAHLLNARGERWLTLERSLVVGGPEGAQQVGELRVPVVSTTPDGRRRVEYMRTGDAARVRSRERDPNDAFGSVVNPALQSAAQASSATSTSTADSGPAPLGGDVPSQKVAE